MTTADQALREAAQKATLGCEYDSEAVRYFTPDEKYRALANPQATLSLLERLEQAEKDRTEAVELVKPLRGYLCTHSEYQKGYRHAEKLMDAVDAFLSRNKEGA